MKKTFLLLAMPFFFQSPVWSATDADTMNWLNQGENVECDINMAKKTEDAKWRIGKVFAVHKKDRSYTVLLPDKSKLKIVNNSKWIKPVSEAVKQSFTQPAEIKSSETEQEHEKSQSAGSKSSEIADPDHNHSPKNLKEKKGGALSRSAFLLRLAFRR